MIEALILGVVAPFAAMIFILTVASVIEPNVAVEMWRDFRGA